MDGFRQVLRASVAHAPAVRAVVVLALLAVLSGCRTPQSERESNPRAVGLSGQQSGYRIHRYQPR